MKSSIRGLLSWVWQVILTWVTGIATNADLSLCIEQTAKMGVKATDPEMGLAHDAQDDETKGRNETGRLIVKEKQVVNTFFNGVTSDVVVTSDVMIGEDERNEIEENNSNRVETDSDKNGAEVSADSLVIANSDSNEVESNSDLTNVNEEGISSNDNEEETERTENQEENLNNSVVNDSASSTTEVNEGNNASNSDKAKKAQNGNSNNRNQSDDESDTDEDEDEEDYDGGYGRGNVAKDVKVTLLLDLSSNAAYQKLLSPQYYSLNFRTVAPLQEENVRTALKKLRSMLPWLGLGFRQQKGAMWLCLYSEDNIDFQTVNYEENQWYLVTNCREQFSYFENGCLCTFRLMKVHPCIQCQRDVMEMQTNETSSISQTNETSSISQTNETSSIPLETSACSRTASTSTISTSMTKDVGEVFSASNCKDTGANYGSVGSIKGVTDPSIINIINSEIPSIHTVNDEFTALPVPNSDSDSSTITEVKSSASLSSNTEKQSTANVPVNLLSGSDTSKDNKETTTFEHNYCLVFGIPQPLVDETSADVICDAFIKELNNGISVTTSASSDPENKNSCHTSEVNSESDKSNVNRDTCSEDNDNQLNNPQSDNATIVSDNVTDNATIVSDNVTDNATIVSDNGTDNATIVAENDTVNATIVSDNDTNDIVTDNNNKQVNGEIIVPQDTITNSIEEQEKFDEIKSSVQKQLTIIENVLASDVNINIDKSDQNRVRNNNINVIDRNSPRIDRQIEVTVTQNFLNKCKRDRVNFVSGFTACVNSAVANTLVKYGIKQENEEFKIGHIISLHNNLEDLSDDDWHDRDYDDDDDDEDDEEQGKVPCCKPATVSLNIRSKDYCRNRFWERVQFINQKRWEMCTDALGASVQKIPLHSEQANKEDRFPSICQPNANLSIANISGLISKYSRQLEHVESVTFQRLSPLLIFLMTNTLSLTVHEKCLRFTFYNQEHFVPHPTAHQFADEIESILKESLVS